MFLFRPIIATVATVLLTFTAGASQSVQTRIRTQLVDLATGVTRDLLATETRVRAARWSPDGRRIVVQVSSGGPFTIRVLNRDGSGVRSYPVTPEPINVQFVWSAKGRSVAFRTMEGLFALDLGNGSTRRLGPQLHPHHLAWGIGEGTVTVARILNLPAGPPYHVQIFDSPLDGAEKLLRDISTEFPTEDALGYFVSSKAFVLLNPKRVIVDPYGTQHVLPGEGPRVGAPGATPDGQWLLFGVGKKGDNTRQLELIDVKHDVAKVINLPFEARMAGFSRPSLLPNHKAAVVLGRENSDGPWKFFYVPVDGGTPRVLVTISGNPVPFHFDISPDGKTLAYSFVQPDRR